MMKLPHTCSRWLFAVLLAGTLPSAPAAETADGVSPDQAVERLIEGNHRYVSTRARDASTTEQRRHDVAESQHPFAIVLGCADSRVPPEVVFDQGLGDLFVVRLAGNVVTDEALGSIEYAVAKLGAPLIVVLGHERCGAVEAALAGGDVPGHIGSLVRCIRPALDGVARTSDDSVDQGVRANVLHVAEQLRSSAPVLSEQVAHGRLRVVGARYDLDTGQVEFLADPPASGTH